MYGRIDVWVFKKNNTFSFREQPISVVMSDAQRSIPALLPVQYMRIIVPRLLAHQWRRQKRLEIRMHADIPQKSFPLKPQSIVTNQKIAMQQDCCQGKQVIHKKPKPHTKVQCFKCHFCGHKVDRAGKLGKHIISHEHTHYCSCCGKRF